MRTKEDLNVLFAQAREARHALVAELEALGPDAARGRLEKEPVLVRVFWIRWRVSLIQDIYASVAHDKAETKALNRQVIRITAAAAEAAKRYYGYKGSRPLQSRDAWTEAAGDLLSELSDVPVTIVTHEFDRALHAYR